MAHPKGVLLERVAKLGLARPEFRTEQTGPEHEPQFLADVIVDGEVLGTGQGGSKRTAETRAAEEALAQLDSRESGKESGKESEPKSTAPSSGRKRGQQAAKAGAAKSKTTKPAAQASKRAPKAPTQAAAKAAAQPAAQAAAQSLKEESEMADDGFDGPWPMFDDLLAAVLEVAERRVSSDLRGDEAREAIRDFSLALYKDLLSDLGDVVEDDDDDEEDDED